MNEIKNKFSPEESTVNKNQKSMPDNEVNDKLSFNLSKADLNILFKYLSRAELKGVEVPEFNNLLNIFRVDNV
jgi:hypothetical protein